MLSDIAVRLSDIPLSPVNSLATASDTVGLSAREPVYALLFAKVANLTLHAHGPCASQRNSYFELLSMVYDAVSVSAVTDSDEASGCSVCHDEPPSVDTR